MHGTEKAMNKYDFARSFFKQIPCMLMVQKNNYAQKYRKTSEKYISISPG
jgi:hypothetical protein